MTSLPACSERTRSSGSTSERPRRPGVSPRLAAALVAFCLGGGAFTTPVSAIDVKVTVKDSGGRPVENAVVYALMPARKSPRSAATSGLKMDQQNKEFVPHVLPVQVGTAVTFPNRDNIRHHVYSFSPAKVFDLPLYTGTPAAPVVFDKPGVVVLGCNIHDWMLGYIFVPDTPYFDKTSALGAAHLRDLPATQLEIRVWHPHMKETSEKVRQTLSAASGGERQMDFVIALIADPYQRRRPAGEGNR